MRQLFSGTAEWIFMKLLPNDSGESVVSNVVPPPEEWRMLMICVIYDSAARYGNPHSELRYDSGAISTGRHARWLRYKIMSARMDLI